VSTIRAIFAMNRSPRIIVPEINRRLARGGLVLTKHPNTDDYRLLDAKTGIHSPPIVERLTGGADIAVVFRFVSETLGAKEWAPLSVDTVSGPHVGSDAPIG
jgi:hypothetical protein